jgi:hypothetical protein
LVLSFYAKSKRCCVAIDIGLAGEALDLIRSHHAALGELLAMIDTQQAHAAAEPPPEPVATQTTPSRTVAPPGPATLTVVQASIGPHRFREGEFLKLRLDPGGGMPHVFEDLPLDRPKLVAVVAKALGVDFRDARDNPGTLVDRSVSVTLKHVTRRDGLPLAVVDRWLGDDAGDTVRLAKQSEGSATTPQQAAEKLPPPTPMPRAAELAKQLLGDDGDIPF